MSRYGLELAESCSHLKSCKGVESSYIVHAEKAGRSIRTVGFAEQTETPAV